MELVPKVRLHDILTRPPTVAYLQHNVEFLKSSNYIVKIENIVWFKELSLAHLSWHLQVLLKLKDFLPLIFFHDTVENLLCECVGD